MSNQRVNSSVRLLLTAPQLIILSILVVILLFVVVSFALILNRQLILQRQSNTAHSGYELLYYLTQLEREHLLLYAMVANKAIDRIDIQRQLLTSRINIITRSAVANSTLNMDQGLEQYRAAWPTLQQQLDQWSADPANDIVRSALLDHLNQMETLVNRALQTNKQTFDYRLAEWLSSSEQLATLLSISSIAFSIFIMLTGYSIYKLSLERRRAEAAVRTNEQRLRALLDTIPDAVFRRKRDGIYTDFKPAKNFQTYIPPEQFIGKNVNDLLPPDIARAGMNACNRALDTGQQQIFEYQMLDSQVAELRDFEARVIPSGEDEVQIIVRDVTQEKRQEEARRQTQKLESLGVLAGGVAHDFNNLLTGILGQTSLAKLKLARGLPAGEHIDKAAVSAERASDLTRQLLAYAGKAKFQIIVLDLNQIIRDYAGLLATALPPRSDLQLDLSADELLIEGDRGQIQQVVMNLVINGADAIQEQTGMVRVATSVRELTNLQEINSVAAAPDFQPGRYVVLEVSDNGIGMDQATMSRIFDPFFSTKAHGHGLGLSATLGIIRTHRGALQVQSLPGKGTTFTIFFPIAITQITPTSKPDKNQTAPKPPEQAVLVIDDESFIRDVVRDVLTTDGLKVLSAANGEEGLLLFRQHTQEIGVVVLDMKMPGLSGEETYRALRQISPDIKVILSSGYSETDLMRQLGKQPNVIFLPKPYDIGFLGQCVQEMLVQANVVSQPTASAP
jgi:PAS domain S-box-containing protein